MGRVVLGVDAGSPPSDAGSPGGPVTTASSDAGVPSGYPTPTLANRGQCTTVPISDTACAGSAAGVCVECLFGGSTYNSSDVPPPTSTATAEAGNYVVTVQLGGAEAGQTTISTESQRGLLGPVSTRAGQTADYAFAVDVRGMEGQPDHAGGFGGYPGLDLFFWGPAAAPPQVSAIGYQLATTATSPVTVFIASDSTACDQTGGVFGGWGQMLPEFFAPPIEIANYANSGASSSSFIASQALWGGITSHWKAGDYVLVQFGHNDKGVADSVVQTNLEKYVTQAKAAHVTPILVSPPARVQFVGNVEGDQSSLHAVSAQGAAMAEGVAFIDLTALSTAWYNSLGSQAVALTYHAMGSDPTHTNLVGAEVIASLVAKNIKDQNLPLAKYLR
jgi:lysophospholipase L1-like esterase